VYTLSDIITGHNSENKFVIGLISLKKNSKIGTKIVKISSASFSLSVICYIIIICFHFFQVDQRHNSVSGGNARDRKKTFSLPKKGSAS